MSVKKKQYSKLKQQKLCEKKRNWLSLTLAFSIPFLGFLLVLFFSECEPFYDGKAFLYSDEYHQYYPFFVNFREALRSGDSLTYNWQIGMGVDYLGLISYYLGSPLNLLSVLVPEGMLLEYFSILPAVRLGFAGLFFAIMLKKLYGKNDVSIAMFGALYALCAWALAYQWNVMWLDTFALLPLVMLGTISLLRDKKVILYTVSLFFSIVCNYYIGLFTCIFVMLVALCYEICNLSSFKRLAADFARIAIFSLLAIGMTAFLELPAVIALGTTQSSNNTFPTDFILNIVDAEDCIDARKAWDIFGNSRTDGSDFLTVAGNWFTALWESFPPIFKGMKIVAGNLGGGIQHSFKEGLPNIYSGVCTLFMCMVFLTSRKIKIREKICSVLLLVFFIVSFLLYQLDYIWHGFHFPNMIPHRFSFLFSFVLIWMAYRAWLLRDEIKLWQLIASLVLTVGLLLLHEDFSGTTFVLFNAIMLVLTVMLFTFLYIRRRVLNKRAQLLSSKEMKKYEMRYQRMAALGLSAVVIVEVAMNLFSFGNFFSVTTITNYPRGKEDSAAAISYMQYLERNTLFYRSEVTHTQTYNDAALNNYNGITTFTSSANVNVTKFMQSLGYGAKPTYNRYAFEESSPVGNLFLDLKYMIERDGDVEDNPYFDTVHHFNKAYLLKNNAYLPLGFLAESELADWEHKNSNDGTIKSSNSTKYAFEDQSSLFRAATGIEEDVWKMSPDGCLNITANNVKLMGSNEKTGRCTYNATTNGKVTYSFFIPTTGFMCIEINAPKRNNVRIYTEVDNMRKELYSETLSLPQMLSVAQVNAGDYVWIEFDCKAGDTGSLDVQAGVINEEVFRQGYDILSASTLNLTHHSNTLVEGNIDCNRDGLLYVSIPYTESWHVELDGKEVTPVQVGGCMIGVPVTEGYHKLVFRYQNSAFTTGLIISFVSLALFVGLVLLNRKVLIGLSRKWEAQRAAFAQLKAELAALETEQEAALNAANEEPPSEPTDLPDAPMQEE